MGLLAASAELHRLALTQAAEPAGSERRHSFTVNSNALRVALVQQKMHDAECPLCAQSSHSGLASSLPQAANLKMHHRNHHPGCWGFKSLLRYHPV